MAEATDQVFDHEYDGIKEYDNPLPRWWVWMFIGTVVWAVIYVPYYHFGPGPLPLEAYEQDMAAWYEAHPPTELASAEELETMAGDQALIAAGEPIFATRCASCHAADGGGLVGPNLCDDHFIHGASMVETAKVIMDGVPDKGMIPWKDQLSTDEIYAVTAYVRSLRGTTPEKPKEAQGEKVGG